MIRNDFPIFKKKDLVYLDSAATSQKPSLVINAVSDFYINKNSNIHRGFYPLAEEATNEVESIRGKVASFINADSPDEIIFTSGTTHAVNLIASSILQEKTIKKVCVSIAEHHSNFVPWQILSGKYGKEFSVIDIDNSYSIDLEDFSKQIKKADILAISHISNVLGVINPIKKLIRLARKTNPNIIVVIDAAQSVPHIKIDVKDLDCDYLVYSGHKIYAETGIGVLYGRKEHLAKLNPIFFGGHMIESVGIKKSTFANSPARFEAGTNNISGIISLGSAIDYINKIGFSKIEENETELFTYLFNRLRTLEFLDLYYKNSSTKKIQGSLISFNIKGVHSHDVAYLLGQKNICVRAGHHCAMPLHKRLGIDSSVRVSLGIYNNKNDVDILTSELKNINKKFNK